MLLLQNLTYIHPNKDMLFDNINLTVNAHDKIAIIGNNGIGKSTLLKIIANELQASSGHIKINSNPYYIPQIFGQYNHLTIGEALQIQDKLNALKEILNGNVTEENLNLLNDDWTIEERCSDALNYWNLKNLDLTQKMDTLSGGEKTKVFLAGLSIHQPDLVLIDEPSNHLDIGSRQQLYNFIQSTASTIIVVSHDRKLLNLINKTYELNRRGITVYGGNYDFYIEQRQLETNALNQDIQNKEKALRKAKEKEREILERQQKLDARGKGKQEKAGIARIMMNTLRNKAENSTSKIKASHSEKIEDISQELFELRSSISDLEKMKFGFYNSSIHNGKILFSATDINVRFNTYNIWEENLNLEIISGERIALKGLNGSGKTTLIKIILGSLDPQTGVVYRAQSNSIYIDQDYSLLKNKLKIYEQAQQFNTSKLQEHEIKIRLDRFLFSKDDWDKPCINLSGGERLRLLLCCLTIGSQSPDIIVLDEPTNNLDIQSIGIMTAAINEYKGTLIVVSHDEKFLKEINIERTIEL